MDFMTSDKTSVTWSPREVLVGVLRAARLVNSPFAVRYVLNYAKAKWSEEDLRDAANCLGGECDCPESIWSCSRVCCAWCVTDIDDQPFTILSSFFMARTKVDWPHGGVCRKSWCKDSREALATSCPTRRRWRWSIWAFTACSVHVEMKRKWGFCSLKVSTPTMGRDADMFGRTPLMHAIYHKKPSMVEALLQAGAKYRDEKAMTLTCLWWLRLQMQLSSLTSCVWTKMESSSPIQRHICSMLPVGCNSVGIFSSRRQSMRRPAFGVLFFPLWILFLLLRRPLFIWNCRNRATTLAELLRKVQQEVHQNCASVVKQQLSKCSASLPFTWIVLQEHWQELVRFTGWPWERPRVCVPVDCVCPHTAWGGPLHQPMRWHSSESDRFARCRWSKLYGPCQAIPSSRCRSHPAGLWWLPSMWRYPDACAVCTQERARRMCRADRAVLPNTHPAVFVDCQSSSPQANEQVCGQFVCAGWAEVWDCSSLNLQRSWSQAYC